MSIRKQGLWVLGMQIIYGLRISEVFAIKNLDKPVYDPKANKLIVHAYNDTKKNPHRLIYIGDRTNIGTTVKTGSSSASRLKYWVKKDKKAHGEPKQVHHRFKR